jgi:hypothetical protein
MQQRSYRDVVINGLDKNFLECSESRIFNTIFDRTALVFSFEPSGSSLAYYLAMRHRTLQPRLVG